MGLSTAVPLSLEALRRPTALTVGPSALAEGAGSLIFGTGSPNDHPNPSQEQQKGFGKKRNLKFFEVSLNSPHNNKFEALGVPMAGASA